MRLAKLVLTNVEVANIDAPPANASVATYLDSYRDFPQTDCRDLSVTFGAGRNVDEILKSTQAINFPKEQECVMQWRDCANAQSAR
jgi:hypothetical protein